MRELVEIFPEATQALAADRNAVALIEVVLKILGW
jgi:hypothetical protein